MCQNAQQIYITPHLGPSVIHKETKWFEKKQCTSTELNVIETFQIIWDKLHVKGGWANMKCSPPLETRPNIK